MVRRLAYVTSFFILLLFPLAGSVSRALAQTASGVAATVDGAPISNEDVERLLRRRIKGGAVRQITAEARKRAVDDLILMRLVEGEMMSRSLDQSELEKEIELSRLETIQDLYLDERTKELKPPSDSEIEQFIKAHPEFFESRKSFYFSRIEISGRNLDVAAIKTMAQIAQKKYAAAKDTDEKGTVLFPIMSYVQAIAGDATHMKAWKASEQVDQEVLAQLQGMKAGDVIVDDKLAPGKIRVLMLYESEPNPLDPSQAQTVVSRGILMEKTVKLAQNIMADLSSKADIRYGADAEKAAKKIVPKTARGPNPEAPPNFMKGFRWKHLWIAWILALLTLTPAAAVAFHRRNAVTRETAFFVDSDTMSAMLNKLKLFSLSPFFEVIVALGLSLASLGSLVVVASRFSLFSNPVITAQMALTGVCAGSILILLWRRFAGFLPARLANNRWTAAVLLVLAQLAGVMTTLLGR